MKTTTMKDMVEKEMVAATLGYLAILGFSALFGGFAYFSMGVSKRIGLISDNQTLLIGATILFLIGPVAEEISKSLAVRANLKFYPLILGGIEFLQYVLFINANVFMRLAAWTMHIGTGEIHRRYRERPIKGLVWAILAHQAYNMLVGLLTALYVRYSVYL